MANHYRRTLEPVVRGWPGIAITALVFAVAGGVGGRTGAVLAAGWVLVTGTYCLANFVCRRETHCVFTGTGWIVLALFGLTANSVPGGGLRWCQADVLVPAYLVILGIGYALEHLVTLRTGHHLVGAGRDDAEAC